MTKVAVVVQRYGQDIVGGAESLCRLIAERLVAQLGWSVTVYTTEAIDYVSWKNEIHRPLETINGVQVKRFKVLFQRNQKLFGLVNHWFSPLILKLAQGKRLERLLGRILEKVWIILQGPFCPGLVRALRQEAGDFDKVFFFTYLYYPTIFGARALKGGNFALIPTAHREAPFYFQHMRKLLLSSARILVNIQPEQALIESRVGSTLASIKIAGLGFDIPEQDSIAIHSLPNQGPFILYLGRICQAKGLGFLIAAFQEFLLRNPGSKLNLVLVGKKDADFILPKSDRLHYLGFVDEAKKFALIKQSLCVVNPSQYESLSMIAIEAMACLKPLLLNEASEVLHYYCQQVETCFGYSNLDTFIDQLAAIYQQQWHSSSAQSQLMHAKTWSEQRYSWAAVMNAYVEAPNFSELTN